MYNSLFHSMYMHATVPSSGLQRCDMKPCNIYLKLETWAGGGGGGGGGRKGDLTVGVLGRETKA